MGTRGNRPFDSEGFYKLVSSTGQGEAPSRARDQRAQLVSELLRRKPVYSTELFPELGQLDVRITDILHDAGAVEAEHSYLILPADERRRANPGLIARVGPYVLPATSRAHRHDTRRVTISKIAQDTKNKKYHREVFDMLVDCSENTGYFYPDGPKAISKLEEGKAYDNPFYLPLQIFNDNTKELNTHTSHGYEARFQTVEVLGEQITAFEMGSYLAPFACGSTIELIVTPKAS